MNKELNRKLAGWAGFEFSSHMGAWNLRQTDGLLDLHEELPDFTESLDACFKWLVPKVIGTADYSIIVTQNLGRCTGYVRPLQGGRQYDAVDNHSPALALCLAIEKMVGNEG